MTDPCDGNTCSDICFENTSGNAECACHEGRELIDNTNCQDIDNSRPCDNNQCGDLCFVNVAGSAECGCFSGRELVDQFNCEAIDISRPCDGNSCGDLCFENENGEAECGCFDGRELSVDGENCQEMEVDNSNVNVGWSLYIDDSKKIRAHDSELGEDYCFTKRFSGFQLGQKIFFWTCTLADTHPKVTWDWLPETGQIRSIGAGDADMCIGFRNLERTNKRATILQNCNVGGVPLATTQWKYVDGRFIALNNQNICLFYKPQDFVKVGTCFKNTFGKIGPI